MTREQISQLRVWVAEKEAMLAAGSWIAGASLGGAYIDTRYNGGRGISKRRAYVRLDHKTAEMVPECVGMNSDEVKALLTTVCCAD
jgi:hypothetical protein